MEGVQIKRIRQKANYSQEEFSKIIGVSLPTICLWENNKKKPLPRNIRKIIAFCKDNGIEIPN